MEIIGNGAALIDKVRRTEEHVHSHERWLVKAAAPVGETHVADPMSTGSIAFQANGGNLTWGSWVQIVGSEDTPIDAGRIRFDFHRILVTAYQRNDTIYKFQISNGVDGDAGIAAGDYTEFPIITQTGILNIDPMPFHSKGIAVGTKVWCRVWAVGQVSGTIDFYAGIHEYEK
jgi:hypothetical protein